MTTAINRLKKSSDEKKGGDCMGPQRVTHDNGLSSLSSPEQSRVARELQDEDTQALVDAGVLTQTFQVSDMQFVLQVLVNKHKKLLADKARELMEERKERKEREDC